ncbi:MAG: TIGR01841 family phasin, partial [Pseudomonadaceae bacterium]
MSLFDTEKLNDAQKANLDLLQQISGKLFEGVEQLGQLQLKALRASADAQFDSLRKLAAARDPQGFVDWQASFAQPAAQAERVLAFNRQVDGRVSGTQAEIAARADRQVVAGARLVQGLVENAIKHGLDPKAEGGELRVGAQVVHGKLQVTVADTGLGYG